MVMVKVTFVSHTGQRKEINTPATCSTTSLMEIAVENDIDGIDGDCGGACACSTCHVYVEKKYQENLLPMSDIEDDMLDFVQERKPTSRLACQLKITKDFDGIEILLPETQG